MNITALSTSGLTAQPSAKPAGQSGSSFDSLLAAMDTTPTNTATPSVSMPTASTPSTSQNPAVQKFLDYMKETPAQRMIDTWLSQHGISKKDFDAMSTQDQQKILSQMKQDIEQKMKDAASKIKGSTDITV